MMRTISLTLFAATALAGAAHAQTPPPQDDERGLGEIVVTAQRRQESVQDVPIAIAAFTENELEARGISNTLDLVTAIPNIFGSNNTGLGSANAYYIRGLGNTETIATFDPPVGTYVDDIYLSRQNANNLSLFDVERVEVLRGPQGTLFGRNTTGGAINVVLREPGDAFGGYVEGGYGRFAKKFARASFDLPLADSFAVKVSGYWEDDRGYARNTTTGDRLNDNDGLGARVGWRGELSDNVRWVGSYAHMTSKGENILNFTCDPANPSNCDGRFVTTGLPEGDRIEGVFAPLVITGRKANFGQGNRTDMDLVSSNLEWGIGENLTLNIITGFVYLTQEFALDFFDGRAGPSLSIPNPIVRRFTRGGFAITNDGRHEQVTQEVKLNGSVANGLIDFVGGFFYYSEKNRTDFADIFSIFTGAPGGTPLLLADRTLTNETKAYAGYFQGDLNLGEIIKLTAGVRYTDETKTFSIRDNRAACSGLTVGPTCLDDRNMIAPNGRPIPREQTARLWTPRFAANLKPTDDILLFASATRGFKSGGWNARGTVASQLLPFEPEIAWSYEIGAKTEWLDRRLRANITGYWLDVGGLQTPSALINPVTGAITFITRNFADYRNKGVELELTAVPVEGLNLYANVGYQDDEYRFDSGAPAVDEFGVQGVLAQQRDCLAQIAAGRISGGAGAQNAPACGTGIVAPDGSIAEPVRTPKWTLAIGGSWDFDFGGWGVQPALNASYRAKYETGTSGVSFYNEPITVGSTTYPANPFGDGDFIVGSEGESHWLINASLTFKLREDRWRLSVECTNCFDKEYVQSSLGNYSYISPPMTWIVRAKVGF
jgi:iron complex outermembrane receptor protein